jgi:hypothetical protein
MTLMIIDYRKRYHGRFVSKRTMLRDLHATDTILRSLIGLCSVFHANDELGKIGRTQPLFLRWRDSEG